VVEQKSKGKEKLRKLDDKSPGNVAGGGQKLEGGRAFLNIIFSENIDR